MTRFRSICIALLLASVASESLVAQERLQGAFLMRAAGGAPVLLLPGASPERLEVGAEPVLAEALVRLRLAKDDAALMLGSNGVAFLASGPASFAVERFVQEQWEDAPSPYADMETEPSRSRIVLSQESGEIVVDCSRQAADSRLALETPVGTVDSGRAVWSFSLVYDPRSRIFNFVVMVRGGEIRFSDRNGRSFNLYPGQRLSGVGSSTAPAVEIGELTEDEAEIFGFLEELREETLPDVPDWQGFATRMVPLAGLAAVEAGELPSDGGTFSDESVRPITIDFVPRVPDSIPFRAQVRPPGGGADASEAP